MTDALDAMLDDHHPTKVAACEWASAELPDGAAMDARGEISRAEWQVFADHGVLGSQVSPDLGGSFTSMVDATLQYEGLGASTADNGLIFAAVSHAVAPVRAIAESATQAQLERWFPALCDGSAFGSFAMSEPLAGSDPWAMTTTAVERPDGTWVLNGTKTWCTLGPIADVLVVFAMTAPERGQWGVTAFIVPGDTPGLSRSDTIAKTGLRACPFSEVVFDDCVLPADSVLGLPGAGAAIFTSTIEKERALLYAAQIGAVGRVVELATEFARARVQGGRHIGSHQAVAHRIVDVEAARQGARLMLYRTAARLDRGEPVLADATYTKIATAEWAIHGLVELIQTFGARGLMPETGIERELRDALAGLAFSGTPDVARNVAAAQLGLNRPAR